MGGSTTHMAMDSQIPQSHMIGNEHPSPAEFASAMGQGMPEMQGMPGMGQVMPGMGPSYSGEPSKNIYGRVIDELKVPFVVAMLFFLFSLPPIRILISHYVPSFIKQTGELHTTGMLTVSALVGLTFWVLQRVIAPLLSL